MNTMRVNALSFVYECCNGSKSLQHTTDRCFLAIKHASAAMLQTNSSKGKELGGGSIILTASSEVIKPYSLLLVLTLNSGGYSLGSRYH